MRVLHAIQGVRLKSEVLGKGDAGTNAKGIWMDGGWPMSDDPDQYTSLFEDIQKVKSDLVNLSRYASKLEVQFASMITGVYPGNVIICKAVNSHAMGVQVCWVHSLVIEDWLSIAPSSVDDIPAIKGRVVLNLRSRNMSGKWSRNLWAATMSHVLNHYDKTVYPDPLSGGPDFTRKGKQPDKDHD